MEGYALNLSSQQRALFSHTTDASDTVVHGDKVVMFFFHGGYFEGVLSKQDNIEDDDHVGLGFSADNESYCSVHMANRVSLVSDFENILFSAAVYYPQIASKIRKITEQDTIKIKMQMAFAVAQAIRYVGHDMNVLVPTYLTNPSEDPILMDAISKYYDYNFNNPSYE